MKSFCREGMGVVVWGVRKIHYQWVMFPTYWVPFALLRFPVSTEREVEEIYGR